MNILKKKLISSQKQFLLPTTTKAHETLKTLHVPSLRVMDFIQEMVGGVGESLSDTCFSGDF